ncbi:MAG: NADPH2:quinone reductase, partial [Paracoccaceae bacterium]
MRAMLSTVTGGPETLELTEMPTPEPKKGEVRLRVRACGVNFPDTLIIRDMYQVRPTRPFAPGGEVAGDIEAIGEGVQGFSVGDRVLGLPGNGGFATHLVLPAAKLIPIPDDMPYDAASCLIFTYGTSHHALKDRAKIQPGE